MVKVVDEKGWQDGTFADGKLRKNVNVNFMEEGGDPFYDVWLSRMRRHAATFGQLFDVDVEPSRLTSMQFSRYRVGDHYGIHCDNDETQKNVGFDRKISIWVSLSDNASLGISHSGDVRANTGDAIIFTGLCHHWAPEQKEGERYSCVAWVPGPRWR